MFQVDTRGRNLTRLQSALGSSIDSSDVTQVFNKVAEIISELPDPMQANGTKQGLLLGLVQSGKTVALTTAIAMAADNAYRCFIVLTSDSNWLFDQTIQRLREYLPYIRVEGKEGAWSSHTQAIKLGMEQQNSGIVLVATKNATVLNKLGTVLDSIKESLSGILPPCLIIDDEADQASLDTQMSRRTKNPDIEPGKINDLISQIRSRFACHTYLQVTATPQALFLQDLETPYRPEFTVLVEPGKGYIGGETFFSLLNDSRSDLIRHIDQIEVDKMISENELFIPVSLRKALGHFRI